MQLFIKKTADRKIIINICMDQIGKMYQNRAMVLQKQVNQLEQLLEAMVQVSPNIRDRQPNSSASGLPNPASPSEIGKSMLNSVGSGALNFAIENPGTVGIGTALGLAAMQSSKYTAVLPNRFLINPKYSSTPVLKMFSAWEEQPRPLGKSQPDPIAAPVRRFNPGDRVTKIATDAWSDKIQKAEKAAADKAARDTAAKTAADKIKTDDITKQLARQQPPSGREQPRQTGTDPITGKPIYETNPQLNPQGIDDTVERQRKRYSGTPHEKVTPEALADMESGQIRRQAVSDLDSGVSRTPRELRSGNGATALEYPTMTGREVAGKVAGKVLNYGGKLIDPAGEAASTALGIGSRALGFGTAVGSGVGMLPLVISLFDRQAGGLEQAGSIEGPPSLEDQQAAIDQARKQEQDNIDLDKFAKNPSGRFTPEPETQSERDDRARLGLSQPVAVDMRRIAAKNGTRRGEYSTLQDRPQQ